MICLIEDTRMSSQTWNWHITYSRPMPKLMSALLLVKINEHFNVTPFDFEYLYESIDFKGLKLEPITTVPLSDVDQCIGFAKFMKDLTNELGLLMNVKLDRFNTKFIEKALKEYNINSTYYR